MSADIIAFPAAPRPPRYVELPPVDFEAVRNCVKELPVDALEAFALDAWQAGKVASEAHAVRLFYLVAFIAARIADERLWKQLAGARS